ncbi:hypothetical protein N5P37_011823 [Trichoderma harzianum]|nr:hypothetical protein N5P37_011823 [Trichoderma harzianum]
MELDRNLWYLIVFFGFIIVSLIVWTVKNLIPNPRIFFLKYILYPRLFRLQWGLLITRFQTILLFSFLLCNALLVLMPIYPLPEWNLIQTRVALASIVNLAPLCMGGRAPIIDALNISRQSYYLAHAWIGAIATIEAVMHSSISIIQKQAEQKPSNHILLSGWIGFSLLLGAFCMPVHVIRRLFGRWFLWAHRIIAMGSVAVIFWHVLQTSSTIARMLVGSSCGFWLFTTIFRILRVLWSGHSGTIIQRSSDADAIQLTVRLLHPMKLQPGCYFYIFFPAFWLKYNILQSYTAMAFWHPPESSYEAITELTFLLSRRGNHAKAISQLREGQTILLDGPYGINYELQTYETAVLAAKGMGIAAILPLALSLAARRHHDDRVRENLGALSQRNRAILKEISSAAGKELEILGKKKAELAKERQKFLNKKLYRDAVKKIILFWSLESNEQISSAQEQLAALQALDPNNELFVIWCGFPRYRTGPAPFKESAYWKCLNPNPNKPFDTTIISKIKEERGLLAGSFAVIVSGDANFRAIIRSGTVKAMDNKSIAFIEAEFQPHGAMQRRAETGDIELVQAAQGQAMKLKRKKQSRDSDGSSYSAISESSMYSIQV